MTPEPEAVRAAASWFAAVSSSLDAVLGEVAAVAGRIAAAWPDARGAEWAERAALVHRELGREADASAEAGRSATRLADDLSVESGPGTAPGVPTIRPSALHGGRPGGARLGGTEADRADDERGVRIPQLPEPVDRPG